MIIVKVGNKKVSIPETYSEITVKEFIEIWHILHQFETIELPDGEELNDTQKLANENNEREVTLQLVGHLLGLNKKETKQVDFEQATILVNTFNNFINNQPIDKLMKGSKEKTHFVFDGEMYYYPQANFDKMTFGEYCEIQQLQATYQKNTRNRFDFIANQIAIGCKKKGEKKGDYDVSERTKLFENLTMDIVLAYSFFLTKRVKILSRGIPTSLKKAVADSTGKQDTSLATMAGSTQFTNWHKKESLQKETNTMQ